VRNDDARFAEAIRVMGDQLHLAGHRVRDKTMHAAGDLEGMRSRAPTLAIFGFSSLFGLAAVQVTAALTGAITCWTSAALSRPSARLPPRTFRASARASFTAS
jgi:hypothetical protein